MNVLRFVVGCCLIALSFGAVGTAQPLALSEEALQMAFALSNNVQAFNVTFQVPDKLNGGFFEVTTTHTATAIFSDASSTYWLTVPTALDYPAGPPDNPFSSISIGEGGASVEVVEVANDFREFFALLKENQSRNISPVSMGILLPPHQAQRVGFIYFDQEESGLPLQRISPSFHGVLDGFRLAGKDLAGFQFETLEIVGAAGLGAPVFHQTVDAISGEPSFVLVGMLTNSKLGPLPFSTESVINAPSNSRVLELLNPLSTN